jgi:hypothetical protein
MKHIVTLTTSNPGHEHIALRRRQSTTNYMVEATTEEEAITRASAHFRKLGHYIHEAKVFKKKDNELNEGLPDLVVRTAVTAAKVAKKELPKVFDTAADIFKTDKPLAVVSNKPAPVHVTRPVELPAPVNTVEKIPANVIVPVRPIPTPTPIKPAPLPVPVKPAPVNVRPVPVVEPVPVRPTPVPVNVKPAPEPAPVLAKPTEVNPKPVPVPLPVPLPRGGKPPISPVPPVTPVPPGIPGRPAPPMLMPWSLAANRGEVDPGTLGQYRGLFPIYNFADFRQRGLQENQAVMNSIGRIMTKRKKISQENADSEKNKINMEPKLRGGKS